MAFKSGSRCGIQLLGRRLRSRAAVARMSFCYCIDMEIAFSFQCIRKRGGKKKRAALQNERPDCSGFSWIVSIMVNGFSKCQSSCFIDLASQRGEQTHLDGISPSAKTAQRVRKPNYPEMWSWLCAFVIHNVLPHPISRRSFPHQLDTSQLLSASPVLSDLSVSARPRVFPLI